MDDTRLGRDGVPTDREADATRPLQQDLTLQGTPINRQHLAKYTLGDPQLEQEVLDLFAEQLPSIVQRLREANSLAGWFEAAHTLKGSARAVGADEVAELALQAEKLSEARSEFKLPLLQAAIDRVLVDIAENRSD